MQPDGYSEHWRKYKRLRNLFLMVWLAYVPAVGLFAALVWKVFITFVPSFVFAGLWMLMFLIVGNRLSS